MRVKVIHEATGQPRMLSAALAEDKNYLASMGLVLAPKAKKAPAKKAAAKKSTKK